MPKPPHRRGTYDVRSRQLTAAAYRDPSTRCWKCGLGIRGRHHKTGRPVQWVAGHVVAGQADGPLLAECSLCSAKEGGRLSAARRASSRFSRRW